MSTKEHANCITPPFLLEKLLESPDPQISDAARRTLLTSAQLRGERLTAAPFAAAALLSAPGTGTRRIFDTEHRENTAGPLARSEKGQAVADASVNQAFDGLGLTRTFYLDVLGRNAIDGRGGRLDGYVHYGTAFNNAFWDGRQMVFGDGDGRIFSDLTGSIDVIAHELTHGVTEAVAGLEYHVQPGALNESVSDVFGSLVKQYGQHQTAEDADWLIGNDIFTPGFAGDALRSLKAPGTAYDNPTLGHDQQPAHMKDFIVLPDTGSGDWGGVHYNSGIPNKAFYLVATAIGGYAWQAPGHIWFEALKASRPRTDFAEFAQITLEKAGHLYGASSTEASAVADAWKQVGVKVVRPKASVSASVAAVDPMPDLTERLDRISASIDALTTLVRESTREPV
ncbi:M4 family metallopeptidase [Cellulomonas sp. URHE0023]|uniref:M4 family metallopeptidase n=1 Tax=Cellulomonas sp. URHE0023 TaxID=1380354 RepID=UPI00054F0DA6|nr:M4 family metallopeptidase [Cellulomonas sp. URHE0023]